MHLSDFLFSPLASAIAWGIFNSLWQGLVIFCVIRVVTRLVPGISSRFMCNISLLGQISIGTCFFITLFQKYLALSAANTSIAAVHISSVSKAAINESALTHPFSYLAPWFPLIAALYFTGLAFFVFRLSVSSYHTLRLKWKNHVALEPELQSRVVSLAEKMKVHRVKAFYSRYVESPVMMGFIRPVILLPLATMNHLTLSEFESVVLHELAHIRRNDYVLNLLQAVLDAILFFNPFGWVLSADVRRLREKCCDEMVIEFSEPHIYASALVSLHDSQLHRSLAMTATNKHSPLFQRIQNIMEMKKNQISIREKIAALAFSVISLITLAFLPPVEKNQTTIENRSSFHTKFLFDNSATGGYLLSNYDFLPLKNVDTTPVSPAETTEDLKEAPTGSTVKAVTPTLTLIAPVRDTIPGNDNALSKKDWDKCQKEIERSALEMQKYFKSDAWKKQMELIQKNATAVQQYFQSKAWKDQQEKIQKNAEKIQEYFNSEEWKKKVSDAEKKAEKVNEYFNSPEWKKQQAEIEKSTGKIQEYFNSPEWKKQQKEIETSTGKIQEYFNSPEWKKQQAEIQKSASKIQEYFNSPAWKKQQELIQKNAEKMSEYFNSPEWKEKVQEKKEQEDSSHK